MSTHQDQVAPTATATATVDPASLPLFTSPATTLERPAARNLGGTRTAPPAPATPAADDQAPNAHQEPARTHHAAPPEAAAVHHDEEPVDWSLVRSIRSAVSEQVRLELSEDELSGLHREAHEPLAARLINEEISSYNSGRVKLGEQALTLAARRSLRQAVLDSIFGMGRMEKLLRLEGLEDVYVRGCDRVILSFADGRRIPGPPVAGSDEELIADLQHMAAVNPYGEKTFSSASPQLDMTLPNGDRLSASAWFVPRPTVTIRRHRFTDIALDTLVELGALDRAIQQFLVAAIQAGISVVVSGLPASGKTTMIRALLNELPPSVALATIESEFELGLHNLPERHPNVWATQIIVGGEDGAGEVTLDDLVKHALRQSVDRIVVGEVRGQEILPMLDAMQAGKGSVSTVHATSARQTVDRLVNLAMKAGPHITSAYAYREIASNIQLIVNLAVIDETPIGGRKHRFIQEIDALELSEDSRNGVAHIPLFVPGPDGRAVPTGNKPRWLDLLELYGFDATWLTQGASSWDSPLELLRGRRSPA